MPRTLFQGGDSLSEDNLRDWAPRVNQENVFTGGAAINYNSSTNEITPDAGRAQIVANGGLYVVAPDSTTLTLPDSNGDNYLYASFDPGTDDSDQWEVSSSQGSVPSGNTDILLKAVIDTSNDTVSVRNKGSASSLVIDDGDSPYTTDGEDVILADTSSGAVTVTLSSADAGLGNTIEVVNISGANDVTVDTEGSETIDPGAVSSKTITQGGSEVRFTADGTNWDSSLVDQLQTAIIDDGDSPYTTDGEDIIYADTSSGAVTVTLASADVGLGNSIEVVNVEGSNDVTVNTEGSETIDPNGDSSKTIDEPGWSTSFTGDGTNWDSTEGAAYNSIIGNLADNGEITKLPGQGLEISANDLQIESTIYDGSNLVETVDTTSVATDSLTYNSELPQDVSGSRSVNSWIENTDDQPRNVYVTVEASEDIGATNSSKQGNIAIRLHINSSASDREVAEWQLGETTLYTDGGGTTAIAQVLLSFQVGPGDHYKVEPITDFSTETAANWHEQLEGKQ